MVLVVFVHSEVYLEVNNYFENRTIVNVVATIFGSQEPGELEQMQLSIDPRIFYLFNSYYFCIMLSITVYAHCIVFAYSGISK